MSPPQRSDPLGISPPQFTEAWIATRHASSTGSSRVDTPDRVPSEKYRDEGIVHPQPAHQASRPCWIQSIWNFLRWQLFLFVALIIVFIVLFRDCPQDEPEFKPVTRTTTAARLWKNAATPSSTPTPLPSGVLECFQVHQPVLTPSGLTDDRVSSDGSSGTTSVIAPTDPKPSCSLLLMQHSFAYSYGIPFVGM